MRVVKTFSLDSERDKEILKYLEKQPNLSAYIRDLIRLDMGELDDNTILGRLVKNIKNLSQPNSAPTDLRSEDIDHIKDILKL